MKIFCQIVEIHPLALIVSLPNQLFAHVPITNVSSSLTTVLETIEEQDDDASIGEETEAPELDDLFQKGQYVRAVVTAVHPPGMSDGTIFGRTRDEIEKASRRVELSLDPRSVNSGVQTSDLRVGFVCPILHYSVSLSHFSCRGSQRQFIALKTTAIFLTSGSIIFPVSSPSKMTSMAS
jgi:rRNA biogenesis protein RRP5